MGNFGNWLQFTALASTDEIIFHASKDLVIFDEKIKIIDVDTGREVHVKSFHQGTYDMQHVIVSDYLQPGHEYKMYIRYEGYLQDGMQGYYRSSYTDRQTGEKKWLAVTQFEAISAREAFPCFDEPAMKAVFKLTMGHDAKYTALANMPAIKQYPM